MSSKTFSGPFKDRFGANWFAAGTWGWFVGIGAALAVLGLVAAVNLVMATLAAIVIIAASLFAGGLLMFLHAFGVRRWGWALLWLVCGTLYVAAAGFVLYDPLYAAIVLTFWLAVLLAASGIMRIIVALARRHRGWGWAIASGLVSLAAAALVAAGWPVNAIWVLGVFLAVDFIAQGAMLIAIGLALRVPPGLAR
jgi:uncharacterized membrane protein HdeD (DUF308 family)